MFNLYYIDSFTGKKLLKASFKEFKDLRKAWLAPENRNYILQATEEKEILNLPTRARHNYQNWG